MESQANLMFWLYPGFPVLLVFAALIPLPGLVAIAAHLADKRAARHH